MDRNDDRSLSQTMKEEGDQDRLGGSKLMGPIALAFTVIATVGPLSAMTGGALIVMRTMDAASSGTYLLSGVVALLFSFGFMALARKCSNAGGFASFVALSFGNRMGTATAFLMILAYNATLIAIYVSGALYAAQLIEYFSGVAVPWEVLAFAMVAISLITGYFEVSTSIKVIGVLTAASIGVLLVMCFSAIGAPHPNGFTFEGFAPEKVFCANLPLAIMLAFNCFGGYEATVVYSEETRNPKRNIPIAIFIVVFSLTALYCFITWSLANSVDGSLSAAVDSSTTEFVVGVMGTYAGYGWSLAMQVLIVVSTVLAGISFHNITSRYLFSMSRAGILPGMLSKVHPKRKSPYIASFIQACLSAVVLAICILSGADGFNMIFGTSLGLGALITIIVMAICSAATIKLFVFHNDPVENAWSKFVAPAISVVVMAVLSVLSIMNFDSTTDGYGEAWLLVPAMFVVGIVVSFAKPKGSIHLEADYADNLDDKATAASG